VATPRCDALLVVASELITNSLVHGRGTIEVEMVYSERCVHIEVTDQGDARVHPLVTGPDNVHGRGLQIVAALSSRWGTFRKFGTANTVWAQVQV
jgi:anti-sigma regulatory factor (Ser/Thr protein kinase)